MFEVNSLCKNYIFGKFSVFFLSGKMNIRISCFPCAVEILHEKKYSITGTRFSTVFGAFVMGSIIDPNNI